MKWLIAEDALTNRTGHWFEYVRTMRSGLLRLNDEVDVLADRNCTPEIARALAAHPVLPRSIWHRMSDGAPALARYSRIPLHGLATRRAVRRWLGTHPEPDMIFVPTVLVHHLLGWVSLLNGALRRSNMQVLLFFPNLPIRLNEQSGEAEWDKSPTARLTHWLLRSLGSRVRERRAILAVETEAMRKAVTDLTGLPFIYLPHPVELSPPAPRIDAPPRLRFGAYGGARTEKGSDVLATGVDLFLSSAPGAAAEFAIQTAGSDAGEWRLLERRPGVALIDRYFGPGEYEQQLAATDVLLLPYRRSSYALRVSRCVIEAMTLGKPVVVTSGTTLAEQSQGFGASVACSDGDGQSLAHAIHAASRNHRDLRARAERAAIAARAHFCVAHFRNLLLTASAPQPPG